MSTPENRARYDRSRLRYPSDLTDQEWAIIGPLLFRRKLRETGSARMMIYFAAIGVAFMMVEI